MSPFVFPQGTATLTLAAGDSITVYSAQPTQVSRLLSFPNYPDALSLLGTTTAGVSSTFGPYASGATIVVNAGAAPAYYEVGTAPIVQTLNPYVQSSPAAKTVAVTLTAGELLGRIITGTHTAGATQAYTLPTGPLMEAASDFLVNDSFDWTLINLSAASADTITVAAGSGHTIVGNAIVQSANASTGGIYGNSGLFRTRKTATDTFVTYRVA